MYRLNQTIQHIFQQYIPKYYRCKRYKRYIQRVEHLNKLKSNIYLKVDLPYLQCG